MFALKYVAVKLHKYFIVVEYNFGQLRKNGKLKHSWSECMYPQGIGNGDKIFFKIIK